MSKHLCHAKACKIEVPARMLMCYRHWSMVPKTLQSNVWSTYRRGQEIDKNPSPEYLNAMNEAIDFVAKKERQANV